MEFRDYVRALRKGWVFIVVLTLLGIAIAALLSILKTPEYEATAKVFVSVQSTGSISDLTQGGSFLQNQVKSYADIVNTPIVLQPVIDSLGLDSTVDQLSKSITASSPSDTVILEITAVDGDPDSSARIANAVASSFESAVSDLVPTNAEGLTPVKITVLQDASVPAGPASPNVPLYITAGALIGLVLGMGLAVVLYVLDTRIRNEHDVEAITDAPIVGGIAFDARTPENPLVLRDDPRSPRAESFRTLRTNLQFVGLEESNSFVITSSIPGEGKSTTAANLAIAMALSGQSVVIVDADMRKPRLASYLGIEGSVGLTDVLVGRAQPNEVITRWGDTNLYVLPAGRIPPNPSELLGSVAMVNLIRSLEKSFDVALFDAPPLLPVTDAAVLATKTGGALLMVAAGRAHKNHVRGAVTALTNVGAKVAGVVMTMLPTKGPDSYGYGRYGYAYGYGYGIDEPDQSGETDRKSRGK
ncbi:polysaccharide biosynthesis tyrosine autokinase [Herbiconiux sp. CPCC 205763]|uniref:non-specific protein-tyrosine kinase n=1 Tax=Herbiconiux aconitum TaxID=2970913 RepID=A0ABT2GKM9_9MICO|nr:polysaccharide biosynthesis tyrosine autokinase [Herbiconiux aconitum]MCS5716770.1 polysaccharide biosynthesis tyrosine autokinase [Herbiconiux aconitum]